MTDKRYTKKRKQNGQTQLWDNQLLTWVLLADIATPINADNIPEVDSTSDTTLGSESSSDSSSSSSSSGFDSGSSFDSGGGFSGGFDGGGGFGGF